MNSSMGSNNTETAEAITTEALIVGYYPLALMIVGTILNSLTFIVLCQSSFKHTKKQPTIHYMRTTAIFDILVLYGWNLDHYLSNIYGFSLEQYNIPSCKFFVFFGYYTVQTSAWLRIFVCLDRYLSLSRLHKTWFSHSKNVIIIIICIVTLLALFNLHLMAFGCFYAPDGTVDINARLYETFPMWDDVNLAVYNCIPLVLMIILNSGSIYHLIRLRHTTTVQNSRIQHRSISITLIITTFFFLIMTFPSGIAFGFFDSIASSTTLDALDAVLFTYYITAFPLYIITFKKFRRTFIEMITCGRINTARVAPANATLTQTQPAPAMIQLKATTHLIRHINTDSNA
jgi:hypothetical protein